jgi:hypothetical protein
MTTINIDQYLEEYEAVHPPLVRGKHDPPQDPSKKGFLHFLKSSSIDPIMDCVEKCKFNLYQTALVESGEVSGQMTDIQRIVHVRFANLQNQCMDACKSSPS